MDAKLAEIIKRTSDFIREAKSSSNEPHEKKMMRRFSVKETEGMVKRTVASIYTCEKKNIIPEPPRYDTGRRVGYTLEDIEAMRRHFNVMPKGKQAFDVRLSIVAAIANFKGGVGKTTNAVCLSQRTAMLGYKTLLIDMDSQASATTLCGYVPDEDFEEGDTVNGFIFGDHRTLKPLIRNTHITNLDLIPSCQGLANAEIGGVLEIAELAPEERTEFFKELKYGIDTIKDNYDFVFIDGPPSMGIIGLMTMLAADSLIIPCPCKMLDFVSTRQFLSTANGYINQIDKNKDYQLVKVMVSMLDKQKARQMEFLPILHNNFGDFAFKNALLHSGDIEQSSGFFKTPWEQEKPDKRITENMKELYDEVITELMEASTNG